MISDFRESPPPLQPKAETRWHNESPGQFVAQFDPPQSTRSVSQLQKAALFTKPLRKCERTGTVLAFASTPSKELLCVFCRGARSTWAPRIFHVVWVYGALAVRCLPPDAPALGCCGTFAFMVTDELCPPPPPMRNKPRVVRGRGILAAAMGPGGVWVAAFARIDGGAWGMHGLAMNVHDSAAKVSDIGHWVCQGGGEMNGATPPPPPPRGVPSIERLFGSGPLRGLYHPPPPPLGS